jgi:hypothetical protein
VLTALITILTAYSTIIRCASSGDLVETYTNVGRWTPGVITVCRSGASHRRRVPDATSSTGSSSSSSTAAGAAAAAAARTAARTAAAECTYDVLFEDGVCAQHVLPHTLRYQADALQPPLATLWYSAVLLLSVLWPLLAASYYTAASSSKGSASSSSGDARALTAPVLLLALVFLTATGGRFAALVWCSTSSSSSSSNSSSNDATGSARARSLGFWRRMRCCCCVPGAAAASAELLRLGAPLFTLLLLPWIALLFLGALCLAKTASVTAAAGAAAAAAAATHTGSSTATAAAAAAEAAAQAAAAAAAAAMAAVPWTACILAPAAAVSAAGGLIVRWIKPVYGTLWQWLSAPWLAFLLLLSIKLDAEAAVSSLGKRTARALRWEGVFAPLQLFVLALLAVHYMLPLLWEITAIERPRSANTTNTSSSAGRFSTGVNRVITVLRSCAQACKRRKPRAAASTTRRTPAAAP